ncbi:glycoside hydrolase family 37 protein [Amanita thiersii Skay4041]|uniref:Trehalase n=1 Tax=Amanita thiersii Skay4041 TaxID=703135 RepID=A0A2A9NX19_9AGAR|nr:glycoside hydrolase family 37 protein [Amanita thiersii Skay4041]
MAKKVLAFALFLIAPAVSAQSSGSSSSTVATAVPSPTASLTSQLPSQVALPPKQDWCPSEIFCPGSLLQTVNIAHLYPDDKTFVDKPTSKSSQEVLADFTNISTSTTFGQIVNFVNSDFSGEGQELQALTLPNFNPNPAFLQNVSDPLLQVWAKTVHGFWTQLIRGTNSSKLCGSNNNCESSLIPLNHTFVVPGGRFREQYYWDSFWIVEGLIESELFDIANDTLQNFMDELEHIGFIPNGGRIYYLDRSQPPLFIQMLARYVATSGDKSILDRALPLAEKELKWWDDHRSVQVSSPFSNRKFKMYRYAVNNTAPRPESYLTDYTTANSPDMGPTLNDTQKANLYAELASAAETGWDFSTRWFDNSTGMSGLRSLNVRSTIAIDLNSILYKNHILMTSLYGPSNRTAADRHRDAAASLKDGIIDLLWDAKKLAFYDFDLGSMSRNSIFTAATFYPVWSGIFPNELLADRNNAFGYFSSLNLVMNRYNGTFPATFVDSGLQWDAPNTWPPHQYIVLQALRNLPSNITSGPLPMPSNNQSTFSLVPAGQLNLQESDLPGQPVFAGGTAKNATTTGSGADINKLNGTVVNGGNSTDGEDWGRILERELANRYFTSAFCSWYATGGSIQGVLPRLSDPELNVTQSVNNVGNMFEKFSILDIDSAGRGGEYTVQAGFGWTNGVVLWVASMYGNILVKPQCPSLLETPTATSSNGNSGSLIGQFSLVALFSSILFTLTSVSVL